MSLLGSIAGSILGKFVSSALDSHYAGQQIEKQLEAQKELFEFENSNKHQFEVKDLRAAGLNPVLSAMNPSSIGVGGVSAPNWTSDDDVYGPNSARAIQEKQIGVQQEATRVAGLQAEAALLKARSEANLNDTRAQNERELQQYNIKKIISDTIRNTTEGKQNMANVERIISEIPVNKEKARNIAQDTTHKFLTNEQILEMNTILRDPKYNKDEFKMALAYALATGKNWTDALAFAISKSATDKKIEVIDKFNNEANSGKSADVVPYEFSGLGD